MSYHRLQARVRFFWLKVVFIAIAIAIVAAALVLYTLKSHKAIENGPVTIVLSPHYDDAALSLGGLLHQKQGAGIVATFFTGMPEIATSTSWDIASGFQNGTEAMTARIAENRAALGILGSRSKDFDYIDNEYRFASGQETLLLEMTRDIQSLIAAYSNRDVYVYGPAIFGPSITHPDHKLLHNAFLDVARSYPNKNVRFFIYEDYPYVELYNTGTSTVSLRKYLESDSGRFLEQRQIPLSSEDVRAKIKAIQAYTSQAKAFSSRGIDIAARSEAFTGSRCGTDSACEVVYEIVRFEQ